MTRTFEWIAGGLEAREESPSLARASAALPSGSYTTLRTHGGRRVVRLAQHVQRLQESARLQGSEASVDERDVRHALQAALQATSHPESRVRLTFSPPRLFVSLEPFEPLPASLYADGVTCATLRGSRGNPHAKDTRFVTVATEGYRQLPAGVHEGLLVDEHGAILEGLTSNFFALRDGRLRTEEARVLLGLTRSMVLEAAQGLVPVSTQPVTLSELPQVAEAFITSASRGILPVIGIDGRPVGDGRPGPVTRKLMARLAALVEREAEPVLP